MGWILTSITCLLLFIIAISVDDAVKAFYCFTCTPGSAIIEAAIHVVVNLLIFGALAALIAYIRGRS